MDFDGIPAIGDLELEEKEDVEGDEEEEDEEGEEGSGGKFKFNGRYVFVTWSKSTIDDKEVFYEKLKDKLPVDVKMFGGKELHQDGTPHYHLVFSFPQKKHWPNAARHFSLEGDTTAIRFRKPKPRQRPGEFLENMMEYCAKDGDTFGERLSLEGAAAEQRKRKWHEVIDEEDEKALGLVRELDPRAYMVNYLALEKAMARMKRGKVVHCEEAGSRK